MFLFPVLTSNGFNHIRDKKNVKEMIFKIRFRLSSGKSWSDNVQRSSSGIKKHKLSRDNVYFFAITLHDCERLEWLGIQERSHPIGTHSIILQP
jgi:hypothetical protein